MTQTTPRPVTTTAAPVGPPTTRVLPLWLVLLATYCIGFAVFGEYRYITFQKELARPPLRPDSVIHYPLLALHVLFGAIAMILAWMQVWPWLRNTYPKVHRRIGRAYFFAGVIPAGLLAYPVAILTTSGQSVRIVLFLIAILWSITTVAGLRAAVQKRFMDHRRWMLRNVALTTTIGTSRLVSVFFIQGTYFALPQTYGPKPELTFTSMSAAGIWMALILQLGFVEWYLLRPPKRKPKQAKAAPAAKAAPTKAAT